MSQPGSTLLVAVTAGLDIVIHVSAHEIQRFMENVSIPEASMDLVKQQVESQKRMLDTHLATRRNAGQTVLQEWREGTSGNRYDGRVLASVAACVRTIAFCEQECRFSVGEERSPRVSARYFSAIMRWASSLLDTTN